MFGIARLSEVEEAAIDLIDQGHIQQLLEHIAAEKKLKIHFLRIIGNIASIDNDTYVDILIQNKAIPILVANIVSENIVMSKEALWILSNIAAGTE